MDKTFTKHLFFLAILLFIVTGGFAQTITVGTVDPGPYAPGSTVAVPVSLGTTGSCLDKTSNQFQVILSNSSGSFASGTTVIGSYTGFYAPVVNATIPPGTTAGSYNIEVVTTTPASTSSNTAAITVQAGAAVTPTLSTETLPSGGAFGRCVGTTSPYTITPTSSGTVTATFHNEFTGSDEATNVVIPAGGYQFTPVKTNYTIIAKSTNGGVVGTYGYQLINNNLLNPFTNVGQPFACMPAGGKATLTFGIPTTDPALGINKNYPGTLYTINWGDGTTSVLDYCEIAQAGSLLTHDYSAPTCGSGTPLQVTCQPSTQYCGALTSPSIATAKVILNPTIDFGLPAIACVGTAVTVPNNSRPGPDYSTATQTDCNLQNPNALYDWYFDGTLVANHVPLSYSYVIPATTAHGTHSIELDAVPPADPNAPYCGVPPLTKYICFENPPQPAFTIPSPVCVTISSVPVANTSVVDAAPCSPIVYTWSATPSTYSFTGGTDKNSVSPQFNFTAAGTYTIKLTISDAANTSCATVSTTQTIIVQATPVATLSPDISLCGDNQTLTFDNTSGSPTKVTFTGAASTDTYIWTVTPPAGGSAVFAGGTTANSQYPKITFVGYGTYAISVTHTNACGSISGSQSITFIQPPTVNAGADQTVCAYPVPTVNLSGNVVGGTGYSWSSAGGGTFSSTTSLTPTYTPSASEISAGIATLTLTATSTAPCLTTTDQVVINITPQAQINSPATVATCSGQALNYNITADHAGTNFTWTASVTTGTAGGVTTSGSGNNITDLLTTTGTTDAIVTYTISPTYNSCPGVPFTLQVTVHPLPSISANAPSPVCNNVLGNANITLSSNVNNTSYTWTSSASLSGVTGNSNQSTAVLTHNIVDNLVNNNTTPATVTYTVTPYNGSCAGTPVDVSIIVEPSPITANAGTQQQLCNTTSVTLHANDPSPQTGLWTLVGPPNPAIVFSPTASDPHATVSGLTPGNTYQFQWTITASASCPTSSDQVTVIIDSAPVGGTATANPTEICAGSGTKLTLNGYTGNILQWEFQASGSSTWTIINANTATLDIPSLTQTTQYRALVQNGPSCPNVYSTPVTVTVDQPPTISDPGPSNTICYTSSSYQLSGNSPVVGTGLWSQVSGPPVVLSSNTDNHAAFTPPSPGIYKFRWTITAPGTCPPSSNDVIITFDAPPVGTATAVPSEICAGSNSDISLSGVTGTVVQWESSPDGVHWAVINTTTATTITTAALTQTTQYRAKIHNTPNCPDEYSTVAVVTVDQPPTIANAGLPAEICSTSDPYTLHGNPALVGTGVWTIFSAPVGSTAYITDPNNNVTTVTGLIPGTYQFQWTITASATCPPSRNVVTIKVDDPAVGGTATAAPAEICSGSGSQITLSGYIGSIVRWEYLPSGSSTWTNINITDPDLIIPSLTQTTQYRALVHNGASCPDEYSNTVTVTVDTPPTIANAGQPQEICNTSFVQLNGNNPTVGSGTWSWVTGPNSPPDVKFTNSAYYATTVNGLIPGTYKFKWTITGTGSCPPSSSEVIIKVDQPAVGGTATANPAEVCSGSGSQVTLTNYFGTILEWQSLTAGGIWQTIPNSGANPILQIASLTQTTQYRAKVHSSDICEDVYSSPATVTVDQPPIAANAGPNTPICNATSYKLQGNNPSPGTGKWTIVPGTEPLTGVYFDNDTDPNTVVNGLTPGYSYQFRWTITNSPVCPSTTADVIIRDDLPPVGGTTSSPATVCSGDNQGQIVLAGWSGVIKEWQSSTDGSNWQTIANAGTTSTLNYSQLTQTTQFRAGVISTGICDEAFSTPTTITVNPPTPIADPGPSHDICNETEITMNANNPAPFTGMWTQAGGPPVNILNPGSYNTVITGLVKGNSYKFKWTINGIAPCPNRDSTITINSYADVIPSFTMDKNSNCGALTVNFTNTSTPSPVGTFVWDFGDGSPTVTAINPPPHVFEPSPSGASVTYTIKMTPVSNCGSKTPYTAQVTISPSTPVAALVPNQSSACGTFTLTAKNLSPGDNAQYDFYLKDESGNIVQHLTYPDKRDAVFQQIIPTGPTNYTVYLVATDKCGNQGTSPEQIISVSPSSLVSQIQIKGDVNSVCLGSPVTFQNISTGGDRFTITLYDSNKNVILTLPAGTGDMNYTPTATGVYYVSITAGNTGCGDAPVSALKQFTVYPIPAPSFTWTADQNFNVTFNNTTPDVDNIPASSLVYKWDFGDGSTFDPSYIPPTHHFDFSKAPFTVTLTATTPGTDCSGVTSQSINVTFKGNLFLPNAFIPASSDKNLNTFIAKGFGMKTWHMQIFNNFGQLVWETTKLDSNGSPVEGWDGTYKGRIVEQGVYIWQISATLLNGEEWKGMSYRNSSPSKTGAIHLLR